MQWYDISSVKNSLRLETCRGLFKLIVLLELENSTKAKSKRIYCCSFWLYPKWHFLKTDLNENSQDTIVEKLKWIEEKISGQFFTAALLSLSSPTNTTLLQRHHLSPAQGRFKFREINCNKCFMNKDFFFLVYLSSYMLSSSPDPWSLGSASSHQPTTSAPLKIFTLCSLSTDFSGLHISPLKPKLYSPHKTKPKLVSSFTCNHIFPLSVSIFAPISPSHPSCQSPDWEYSPPPPPCHWRPKPPAFPLHCLWQTQI